MAELSAWLFVISLHLGSLVIEPRMLVVDKSGAVQQVVAGQAVSGAGAGHFWLWAYGRAPVERHRHAVDWFLAYRRDKIP